MPANPESTPPEEEWIGPLKEGKEIGYIDRKGNWVIKIEAEDLWWFSEGLAPFVRKGRIGFINRKGVEVIAPAFTTSAAWELPGFREGLAPVVFENRGTYVDTNGQMFTPPGENPILWNFVNGKALMCTEGPRFTIIDRDLNELSVIAVRDIPFCFDFPEDWDFFPCIMDVESDIFRAYINWKGEFIFPPIYTFVGPWTDGIAPYSQDGEFFGLVRLTGEIIVPPKFRTLIGFSEGLAVAELEQRKFGFVDENGAWAIAPEFQRVEQFSEGLAVAAIEKNKVGFVDRAGKWAVAPEFQDAQFFTDGLACVTVRSGKKGFINRHGEMVIPARYGV